MSDASDTDTWLGSGGHAGEAHFRIRALPELPVTSDAWEFLRSDLSHRVLSIDFERTGQNAAISNEIDVTGETDTTDIIIKTMDAASVAILAKDLRYAYGLPQFQPAQEILSESVDWVERLRLMRAQQRQKEAEFNRRMFEEMEARRSTPAAD